MTFKAITSGSWKTTSAGITAVVLGICILWFAKSVDQQTIMAALGTILPGLGLIFARDNNKTSADVGIDISPEAQATRDAKKQTP